MGSKAVAMISVMVGVSLALGAVMIVVCPVAQWLLDHPPVMWAIGGFVVGMHVLTWAIDRWVV